MTFWIFLYSAAALHSVLLAAALWRRTVNRGPNRILAVWLALVGVDLAVKSLYWYQLTPELFRLYRFVALLPFLYGSLFFLYARALVRGRGIRARDAIHLLGFAVMLLLSAPTLLADGASIAVLATRWSTGERHIGWWFDGPLYVYSLSYVAAALFVVHRYRQQLRLRRSDADRWSLRWVDTMAVFQIIIWLVAIGQHLFEGTWLNYGLLFGMVALWVCVIGWLALNQPALPQEASSRSLAHTPIESASEEPTAAEVAGDDPRLEAVLARVAQLMQGEQPLFLEPALTIAQVAKRSGYPEYLVSSAINRRLGTTFWDYISRLRIDAVCAHLKDPGDARTVLDIAYACGFTSKSTFNTAFKRQTGLTPSAYRQGVTSSPSAPSVEPQTR